MRNVHPQDYFQSSYDASKNRSVWEKSGQNPGMTIGHYYLAHILQAIAANPATMLDPEAHVDYAVKLAKLAMEKTDGWY